MQNNSVSTCDGLVLFSGGLDSVLAAKVLQEQGLRIVCVHYVTPFFGYPGKVGYWRKAYGLEVLPVDISEEYAVMLKNPVHGYGSVLNPCVDCKIVMMRKTAELMERYGARFLASGEVLGQRPMSQRRDTLNIIRRDGGVKSTLLRPLCAKLLEPTEAELSGLVDRERLYAISGRGRKGQLELAAKLGVTDIPTPAGGCLLTEKENARSFWPVLRYSGGGADAFRLARTGRQLWHFRDGDAFWLSIGRNNADNEALHKFAAEDDLTFKVRAFPGPIALLRMLPEKPGRRIPREIALDAAALVASFSGKAVKAAEEDGANGTVQVRAHCGEKGLDGPGELLDAAPRRVTPLGWAEFAWEQAHDDIRALRCGNSCLK